MCGIAGFTGGGKGRQGKIHSMTNLLAHRGPDEESVYLDENIALGHRRLAVVDIQNGHQPMRRKDGEEEFVLVYNGELYNTEELRIQLNKLGHNFKTKSDTEVLLAAYTQWRERCLSHLNGIYAFAVWESKARRLFLARDRFGVKPLFYAVVDGRLVFASEIKAILVYGLKAEIDSEGLATIFALSPTRREGHGVFKGVREVKAAEYLIWEQGHIRKQKYWEFESRECLDDIAQTAEKVRELFVKAVKRQLVSDVPLATFLSGGLDSSAITAVASSQIGNLVTYSFDYKYNELYFTGSEFQPDSDTAWVDRVSTALNVEHKKLKADNDVLIKWLFEAVKARDLPGMADIDSSLLYFCSEVKKQHTVCLSGECADEQAKQCDNTWF